MTNGDGAQRLAAEQRARVLIDRQLVAAGWVMQDKKDLNLFAAQGVAVRESIMAPGHGRADYLLYVDKSAVGGADASVQLHDAVTRYRDALAHGAQRVVGSSWEDAMDAAAAGPLPWLGGAPAEVAAHPTWGPYLTARAHRVTTLAERVRTRQVAEAPPWLTRAEDVVGDLSSEVTVWRAANGIPDDDRRVLGPRVDDPAGAAYQRRLAGRIDARYSEVIKGWEAPIVEYVGRRDEHTTDLARYLDQLQRAGHDVGRLLQRATARRPLPDEHATSALAYRIRRHVTPTDPVRFESHRPAPSQSPGIEF